MTTYPPDVLELIRSTLREVAANAKPPIPPSKILTGETRIDDYHIARLRGIAGLRMRAAGIPLVTISDLFLQEPTATQHQLERAARHIQEHPRYQQFAERRLV